MNDLKCFESDNFGQIRVIERDGEPWFVAKDVCDCLDYPDASDACRKLDDDEKHVISTCEFETALNAVFGNRGALLVSESGLYSLVLSSRKPEAKQFKRWVTHEVIPSIRKTGAYSLAPKTYAEALRALANEVEQKELAIAQRDEAIRTKSHFVEGRDAEMCGRVGGLTSENNRLKDAVGRGRNWQTISMMKPEWIRRFGHEPDWRKLREFSKEAGIQPIKDVEEQVVHHNGVVKVVKSNRYHKDAWQRYERYETLMLGE